MPAVDIQTKPHYRVQPIYDPAAAEPIQGADANESLIVRAPDIIAIEGMDGANLTSVTVQVRIHPDGEWHDYQEVDKSKPNALLLFEITPNFVRVVRVGTDDFKVFAQLGGRHD